MACTSLLLTFPIPSCQFFSNLDKFKVLIHHIYMGNGFLFHLGADFSRDYCWHWKGEERKGTYPKRCKLQLARQT